MRNTFFETDSNIYLISISEDYSEYFGVSGIEKDKNYSITFKINSISIVQKNSLYPNTIEPDIMVKIFLLNEEIKEMKIYKTGKQIIDHFDLPF